MSRRRRKVTSVPKVESCIHRIYTLLTIPKPRDDNGNGLSSQSSAWKIADSHWDYNTGVTAASCVCDEAADSAVRAA
jgi:hypothetical protein